jgi:hypothetical protein
LLDDLWRELSPVVRICLFAGMGLGFFTALYLMIGIPPEEEHSWFVLRTELRVLFVMLFVLTFAGAFAGLVLGVTIELVFGIEDPPDGKKRRRKKP